jgi:hypothetical protein
LKSRYRCDIFPVNKNLTYRATTTIHLRRAISVYDFAASVPFVYCLNTPDFLVEAVQLVTRAVYLLRLPPEPA